MEPKVPTTFAKRRTLKEKIAIAEYAISNSNYKAAELYSIDTKTVRNYVKNIDEYRNERNKNKCR
jgi:hypothetical protein